MPNLKSITELPVAESAEGLNLIVNDNGAAKQIAASAVGAQADFAVTDETSPAFIKNKPAVAQADWAEEDENSPAFIKNIPFYDTREIERVTLTFDGDLTGKDFEQFDDTFGAVKISDKVPEKEELIGSTYSGRDGAYSWSSEIVEDMIYSPAYGVIDVDNMFVIVYPEGVSDEAPVTEGVWTYCGFENDIPVFYTTEISWNSVVSGELKTIEPKYMKDMYYSTQFKDVEILAETTQIPDSDGWIHLQEPMVGLVENGVYTVNWNGVKYVCYCEYNLDNDIYELWSDAFYMTYAKWMFENQGLYAEIEVYDGSTSVTLSIVGSYEEVKKIDEKYIPDNVWYGINDAFNAANNVNSTVYNKMDKNNPTGTGSFSMNRKSGTTIGSYSYTEGYNTTASGDRSHAEGESTTASGDRSHAEGESTTASGERSHAEGYISTASGFVSHAEGYNTIASGDRSHAEGYNTTASGSYSHTEGTGTTSQRKSQHVQGEYNILDTKGSISTRGEYVHIVGNGTSGTARSNAHTLDWNGNAWYQGTVEGTGFILASPNGTKYKIIVADDGTLSAVAM